VPLIGPREPDFACRNAALQHEMIVAHSVDQLMTNYRAKEKIGKKSTLQRVVLSFSRC